MQECATASQLLFHACKTLLATIVEAERVRLGALAHATDECVALPALTFACDMIDALLDAADGGMPRPVVALVSASVGALVDFVVDVGVPVAELLDTRTPAQADALFVHCVTMLLTTGVRKVMRFMTAPGGFG